MRNDCDPPKEEKRMTYATTYYPTAFPVFVVYRYVPKRDGTLERKGRTVIDLKAANAITEKDLYPLPRQEDIISMVKGKSYITAIDARKFFYQWRVKPQHWNRLAVISHRGQEVFNVAIMGFTNSVPYVQRQIDLHLKDLIALTYDSDDDTNSSAFIPIPDDL